MDILSSDNLTALRLCGDSGIISDNSFNTLVANACELILTNEEKLPDSQLVSEINDEALKGMLAAVTTLLLESAKVDLGDDQINLLLDDCNFPSSRKEIFVSVFNDNRSKVREHLSKLGHQLPQITDVGWRLDYNLKNSRLHKVNQLKYKICLNQWNSGEPIEFSCSKEELQDLVSKLKEACKALDRASQL